MKWFMALNQRSEGFADYALMMQVAILSAERHTSLEPHVMFDGVECELTEWLRARKIPVHAIRSRLFDALERHALATNDPGYLATAAGAFLRLELPSLLASSGDDRFVLYTDCDVMFVRDVTGEIERTRPLLFAVAPEFDQVNYRRMNSGVMVMNLPNLRRVDRPFFAYARRNLATLSAFDQGAYRTFFRVPLVRRPLWSRLPLSLNWKPYWGADPGAGIVHFHGPKPLFAADFADGRGLEPHRKLVAPAFFEYARQWEEYRAHL
jgi:hypothetical protein